MCFINEILWIPTTKGVVQMKQAFMWRLSVQSVQSGVFPVWNRFLELGLRVDQSEDTTWLFRANIKKASCGSSCCSCFSIFCTSFTQLVWCKDGQRHCDTTHWFAKTCLEALTLVSQSSHLKFYMHISIYLLNTTTSSCTQGSRLRGCSGVSLICLPVAKAGYTLGKMPGHCRATWRDKQTYTHSRLYTHLRTI